MQLQSSSNLWTPHWGVVSFSPLISLRPLEIVIEQRVIACTVVHANTPLPPITLINIHAPATYSHQAHSYQRLLELPLFQEMGSPASASSSSDNTASEAIDGFNPTFILGDFNYHAHTYLHDINVSTTDYSSSPSNPDTASFFTPHAQSRWASFLNSQFFEFTHSRGELPILPTFRCGLTQSTIDYLYASPFLYQDFHSSKMEVISSEWTDHALLRARFMFPTDK